MGADCTETDHGHRELLQLGAAQRGASSQEGGSVHLCLELLGLEVVQAAQVARAALARAGEDALHGVAEAGAELGPADVQQPEAG